MTTDVLRRLAAADPVREAELPRPAGAEARALKARIVRTEVPRRLRPRVALVMPLVVGAVAAAVMLALPRALERDPVGVSPAAAAVLERAAAATARTPHAVAGRYAYTEARTVFMATDTDAPPFTALVPSVQETWLAADGSGQLRTVRGKPYFPSERDRSRWVSHGSPPLGSPPGSVSLERLRANPAAAALGSRDPATLDARELDALLNAPVFLPVEPARLERVLRAYAATKDPPPEDMMFNQLEDLLTNPYASAELRAASYRVLAGMKGIELRGSMDDPAGRRGTAIDFPNGYGDAVRHRLIVDPATGAVLAEQTLLAHSNDEVAGEPGEILGEVVYVKSGWVGKLGALPATEGATYSP
jgi:hypothetical protein